MNMYMNWSLTDFFKGSDFINVVFFIRFGAKFSNFWHKFSFCFSIKKNFITLFEVMWFIWYQKYRKMSNKNIFSIKFQKIFFQWFSKNLQYVNQNLKIYQNIVDFSKNIPNFFNNVKKNVDYWSISKIFKKV